MKFLNFLKAFITYLGFFLVVACLIAKANVDVLFKNGDGTFNVVGQFFVKLSGEGFYTFTFMFIPIIMILGHLIFGLLEDACGLPPKANLITGIVATTGLIVVQILLRTLYKCDSFFIFYNFFGNIKILDMVIGFRVLNIIQFVLTFVVGFCVYSFFVGGATYQYITITTFFNESGMEMDQKTSGAKYAIWLHIVLGIAASIVPLIVCFTPLVVLFLIPFILFLLKHSSKRAIIIKAIVFSLVGLLAITPVVLTNTGVLHVDNISYVFNQEKDGVIVSKVDYKEDAKTITIPEEYWGYEVDEILNGCLEKYQSLETLIIPKVNHKNVGYLFKDKDTHNPGLLAPESLKTIKLTNQEFVRSNTFANVTALENIYLTEKVKYIKNYAFEGETLNFNIDGNVKYIGTENNPYYAAISCSDYGKIFKYHEDTVTIGETRVFSDELEMVIIPKSVKYFLQEYFFSNERNLNKTPNLKGFFYEGSMEDSTQMELLSNGFGDNKHPLSYYGYRLNNFPVYYYSESKPTEEGNFWKYAEDNVTPVIW